MQVLQSVSAYLTTVLGIGVLLIGIYYVWEYVFRLTLSFFRMHDLFRQFIFDSYRKKRQVFTPEINDKEEK